MNRMLVFKKVAMAVLLILLAAASSPVLAACIFNGGSGGVTQTFILPATIIVEPDTPIGTILYENSVESGEVKVDCDSQEVRVREGYTIITDADARGDVLPGVYKTNVAGIGIRVAAAEERVATFNSTDLVTPLHYVGMRKGSEFTTRYHTAAELVVIGEVADGYLDTSRLYSEVTYDNVMISAIAFSPASVHITTNTCNLAEKNIYVPLKTLYSGDWDGQYSAILSDDNFKIKITDCAAGTQVDYQFKSAGSTGVTDGNILNIASGDSTASGVGIQILDKNNTVLSFDQDYTATSSTSNKEVVEIPLKARYIKTGTVKGGDVDAIATFEVYYR